MNLVNDPWIPVVLSDGSPDTVGLSDLFQRAEVIRDLSVDPPRRVALTRLLICIAQAALDGPKDDEDWYYCKEQIPKKVKDYLFESHRLEKFDLFGNNPFLQIMELEAVDSKDRCTTMLSKLDISLASGNAHTLFDHEAGSSSGRQISPDHVALTLLTCQNFALGGGQSKKTYWNSGVIDGSANQAKHNNFTAGPCAGSKLFLLLRAENLLSTIHLNMLPLSYVQDGMPNSDFGEPIWDLALDGYKGNHVASIKQNYLSRLVPLSRFIRLSPNNHDFIEIFTNGYSYPNEPQIFREPMCTIFKDKNDSLNYLQIKPGRHPWRDLSAILILERDSSPLCLQHLFNMDNTKIDIWVGGLLSDQGNPIESCEWVFSFFIEMLDSIFYEKYSKGVTMSNSGERSIKKAVSSYYNKMGDNQFQVKDNGKFKRNDPRSRKYRDQILGSAASVFWAHLDSNYNILVETAKEPMARLGVNWYREVRNAMEQAYAHACPSRTPRQIQAYALGLKQLRLKKPAE